jgi:hypothetical protein
VFLAFFVKRTSVVPSVPLYILWNVIRRARHAKERKLAKTFTARQARQEAKYAKLFLTKGSRSNLLFNRPWRAWLLGVLGGLKRRLGELPFLGVLDRLNRAMHSPGMAGCDGNCFAIINKTYRLKKPVNRIIKNQ